MSSLDAYDRRILYELDINSRRAASAIARTVRLSREAVNHRIHRLYEKGYIGRAYCLVNAGALGLCYYKIYLKFSHLPVPVEYNIMQFLREELSCFNLRTLEGHYDMAFLNLQDGVGGLREFMNRLLSKFGSFIREKNVCEIGRIHKLNQRFLYRGYSYRFCFDTVVEDVRNTDSLDVAVLDRLMGDCRIRVTDIAKDVGVEAGLLRYRIRRMEQDNTIVGYGVELDIDKLGLERVQLDLALTDPGYIPSIVEFFDLTDACGYVYELVGTYELSLNLYVSSDAELRHLLESFRKQFLHAYSAYEVAHVFRQHSGGWSPSLCLRGNAGT